MTGTVARVAVKPKMPGEVGLPKAAVPVLHVTAAGAAGDYNHYRATELGGDADQAVLVVTEDLLTQLAGEGWPVAPGDLGENLTLAGVAESALRPGIVLAIGPVSITITKACDPCDNLYALPYVGKQRGPAFLKATVGRRGWYGRVNTPGAILPGAAVHLAPAHPEAPATGLRG